MVRSLVSWQTQSLRRRFVVWFGLLFVLGTVIIRLSFFQATVVSLAHDLDELLWSRLGGLRAIERFQPEVPLLAEKPGGDWLLPKPQVMDDPTDGWAWLGRPRVDPGAIRWFAGVWRRDGSLANGVALPAALEHDPEWWSRCDTIWTTVDGRYRLTATAGSHGTLIVVGAHRDGLAAANWRVARFEFVSFSVWVPLVLGVAWGLLSRVLVPVAAVTDVAHRIHSGHFEERLDASHVDAEFREMAETVNDMLDRLEVIRASQSRFNADVAHQLMNPVHAILLETDESGPEKSDAASSFRRISDLARRIQQICEVLLAYSRSASLDPSRLKPVDLEPIVDAAIERVEPRARARGMTIEPPPCGAVVKGDEALLEEVFVNLLANAVEHGPLGSSVNIVTSSDPSGCRIAVVDHGAGVPEAEVPKLFERFHSGKPSGGHGVGLALSRLIMRSHGGDVAYAPTPGGGATFTLSFPPRA